MKIVSRTAPALRNSTKSLIVTSTFAVLFSSLSFAQSVTEVITDYAGYWKSGTAAISTVKPDNAHNLLAFTYNNVSYSTGVNDALLATKGLTFAPGDFWSLPFINMSGTINSNTKVGLGALYDGVHNGPSSPAPAWGISSYLTDGIKGLGLGTCIANLPTGNMMFSASAIDPLTIGDGIPDILVTQVADPTTGAYDRYEFTDAAGNRVGSYKDIVFTNISSVGNWTADFYEASQNPLTLSGGFTQTDRSIRLWAADLSEFGITPANYRQVANFKVNLCGNSDVAFVAYNHNSVTFKQVLPVQYNFFTASATDKGNVLNWQTASEQDASHYEVERSSDGISFIAIGNVVATNAATTVSDYSFTDAKATAGKTYYRLKQADKKGGFTYSKIISVVKSSAGFTVSLYPNPAKGAVYAQHNVAGGAETIAIYTTGGVLVKQVAVAKNTVQTKVDLQQLNPGTYFLAYAAGTQKAIIRFVIN